MNHYTRQHEKDVSLIGFYVLEYSLLKYFRSFICTQSSPRLLITSLRLRLVSLSGSYLDSLKTTLAYNMKKEAAIIIYFSLTSFHRACELRSQASFCTTLDDQIKLHKIWTRKIRLEIVLIPFLRDLGSNFSFFAVRKHVI